MPRNSNKSFTLIELLVVLALVAILSVVVILTLNPAELIKQARDSNRLSDLSAINTALNLFSADVTSGFMGTSTVVYVSIPSASPTCSNLGLPTLPSGYTYNCATSQNLRNIDGTGWIPVNFQRISSNSPISQLPIDPINTTTTRLYYSYVAGGSWELNAAIEASKNKLGGSNDLVSKDGGSATSQYEIGNNLNLNPVEVGDSSLVGYWNFEEGPNATSSDRSGYGNHGTWYGTSTQNEHYATGRVGSYAGQLNGVNDYISIGSTPTLNLMSSFTLSAWVNSPAFAGQAPIVSNSSGYTAGGFLFGLIGNGSNNVLGIETEQVGNSSSVWSGQTMPLNQWINVAVSFNGSVATLYLNGISIISSNLVAPASALTGFYLGRTIQGGWTKMRGSVDDIRAYNRALSAAEILALYNATK